MSVTSKELTVVRHHLEARDVGALDERLALLVRRDLVSGPGDGLA